MCTSSVAPQLCSDVLAVLCMFVLLVPAQLFKYIHMYVVVVVVGVDLKDTCVCAHVWGSTVLPLPALCLPQHPTLPAVPRHQPAPPSEAALHCRHQWALVLRVCIPYGRKIWRGIYFGGLAGLRAIRQYFICHKLHTVMSSLLQIIACVLDAPV